MTITITELQSISLDNSVSDPLINPSTIPDTIVAISVFTPTKIVASYQKDGHSLMVTFNGNFTLPSNSVVKTYADFTQLPFDSKNTISSELFLVDDQSIGSIVSTTPIQANLWTSARISSIAAELMYSGKVIINSSKAVTSGERIYV